MNGNRFPRFQKRQYFPQRTLVAAALVFELGLVLTVSGASISAVATGSGFSTPGRGVTLQPGADGGGSCTSSPCATIELDGPLRAQVMILLTKDSVEYPQPGTYFTDLLRIVNPSDSTVIVAFVQTADVSQTRTGDIGSLSLFYCATQTEDPTAGCLHSDITSTVQRVAATPVGDTLGPGGVGYIELSGFAGPTAEVGDSISFNVELLLGGG